MKKYLHELDGVPPTTYVTITAYVVMKKYLYELRKRKDLLLYLVTSGLKAQYRNSFLGYIWWLLDPLLGAGIYYFIVVYVFRRRDKDYGMFLVIGVMVWRWLSSTITMASRSIVAQARIITQVYLPKIIFPISAVLTQLINFGFGLLVIAFFGVFFHVKLGLAILWLPYIALMQLCFCAALAIIVSYISVFVRDMEDVIGHILRIWFFGSPVIWSEKLLSERGQWITTYNPMAYFLAAYRQVILRQESPDAWMLLLIGAMSTVGVSYLTYYFSRHEYKIIKAL